MDYAKQFGEYLRFVREEVYHESLRQFASRVDLSAGYIGKLELGQVGTPRRTTVSTLAQQLGIDSDILLMKAGYTPEDQAGSTREDAVALKFRRLTPEAQSMVNVIIDALATKYTK